MSKMKAYSDTNVYDAARERLRDIYEAFPRVYLSVSFGKDSTAMLWMAIQVAREMGRLPVHILYVDLEGQYQSTDRLAREVFSRDDVVGHWVCLPLNLRNAVSMHQPFWTCWGVEDRERWIRPLPDHPAVVSDPAAFPFFEPGMEFEEFTPAYAAWFSGGDLTACCVGIRTDESLNRFRTIASLKKQRWDDRPWTTRLQAVAEPVFNAYPIYDWRVEDIWTATGRNGWDYNKVYDMMHMAGVPLSEARLCQPYGDDQRRGLDLFQRLEPETWHRVVGRVTGANYGAKYARTALMGFRKMEKPPGHTWRSYAEFLLSTLPAYERQWYSDRFEHFFDWWEDRGIPIGDVPDEADPKLEAAKQAPSWRRIARCLMTNDKLCKSLSFAQTKHQWDTWRWYQERYGT